MKYRILTKESGRWGEGWKYGDIVALDDIASRVPLINGEIEIYTEVEAKEELAKLDEASDKVLKAMLKTETEIEVTKDLKCPICGKKCKNKGGYKSHVKSHA